MIFIYYYIFIYWTSFILTTPLTTINNDILVNNINFIIEINTINYLLKNHAQTLKRLLFLDGKSNLQRS